MARCSRILLLTLGLQILGIFIPYLLVLQRSVFKPPLPFISQTSGFSPECGVFAFLLIPGSFFGVVIGFVIHKTSITQEEKLVKIAENVSFSSNVIYFFSWVLICTTPVTFTDLPNKYEWVLTVLSVHMIGALLMLLSIVVFLISQVIIFFNTKESDESHIYRKYIAFIITPVAFIGISALIKVGFEVLRTDGVYSKGDMSYLLPTDLSFAYIVTAVCEWTLILCMWLCLLTFYKQMSETEIQIQLSFAYIVTAACEWTLILCMWLCLLTFYKQMSETEIQLQVRRIPERVQEGK